MNQLKDLEKRIYEVAIYLRKSRGEIEGEEDDLVKHERELTDLVRRYNWRFVMYREIGSSDSIEFRPEFKRLLKDVENDFYDAVVVMDYDRLSRGDKEERARIEKVLKQSNTLVVTPTRVYDLNDEDQELITDIEGVFARYEYRMIRKRFQRGKKIGARLGHWTNGTPPFPYVYNPETKSLDVDEAKGKIYEFIKNRYLGGFACFRIARELNRQGIPSPGGKLWTEVAIHRLLCNEVHLGRVIYGKTSGSGHKNKKSTPVKFHPRENWIIVENAHPAVKTLEEHAEILATLERRRLIKSTRSRKGFHVYSGLVFCGKCGRSMKFQRKENGTVLVKPCRKLNAHGIPCNNDGGTIEHIHLAVKESLKEFEEQIMNAPVVIDQKQLGLEAALKTKEEELQVMEYGLDRIQDLYVMGSIDRQQLKVRQERHRSLIQQKRNEIEELRVSIGGYDSISNDERLLRVEELKRSWTSLDIETRERNRLARRIIEKILYQRKGDQVHIDVQFL